MYIKFLSRWKRWRILIFYNYLPYRCKNIQKFISTPKILLYSIFPGIGGNYRKYFKAIKGITRHILLSKIFLNLESKNLRRRFCLWKKLNSVARYVKLSFSIMKLVWSNRTTKRTDKKKYYNENKLPGHSAGNAASLTHTFNITWVNSHIKSTFANTFKDLGTTPM